MEVSVPQNSCLGPLLILTCINDPSQAIQGATVSIYADDTNLCYQSHDLTRLNEIINGDLKKLDTWLQGNKLSLNAAKSRSLLIPSRQRHNILQIQNEDLELTTRDHELKVNRNARDQP